MKKLKIKIPLLEIVACLVIGWFIVSAILLLIWVLVGYRGLYGTSGWTPFVLVHVWLSWFVLIPFMVVVSIALIIALILCTIDSSFEPGLLLALLMVVPLTILGIFVLAEVHGDISDCDIAMQQFADFLTQIDEFVGDDNMRYKTQGGGFGGIYVSVDVNEAIPIRSVLSSSNILVVERLSEHSKFRLIPKPERVTGFPRPMGPEKVDYIVAIEKDRRPGKLAPGYYYKDGHGTWYKMFRVNLIDWRNQKIVAGALFQFENGNEPWSKIEQWLRGMED